MNPNASQSHLARDTFLQATLPGPAREPVAVTAALAKLQAQGDGDQLDVGELEEALNAEFTWRNQFVVQSRQPQPDEIEAWTQTVRWLIDSLLATDTGAEGGARRFQVLLTALGVLDVGGEGLSAVLNHFAGTHVSTSLISMLRSLGQAPDNLDARSKEWLQELPIQVREGNFKMLQQAERVLLPRFGSDIWTALFLLWKLEPAQLARSIDAWDSIHLAMIVCRVLGADAPLLALQVQSVTFKFVSLSWLGALEGTHPEVTAAAVLKQLLLQVANTPLWMGWLNATYKHPETGTTQSRATLAEALIELEEPQWIDFISALALSTSRGSAEGVADILTQVSNKLGGAKAQPFWSAAFERWNAWDYGKGEGHFHLSSPQVCSFDFPVAMYYAHLPVAERDALERELQNAIIQIEQQWFANESELCSERNRIASRLRLVRHGGTLAAGGREALPPPVHPDSEYAEVRYRYHDINRTLAKTMGR